MKVLVADDSITVRKIAERQLTEAGFEVTLAASGEEALAWLEHERPDLIISDVIMPNKNGYDVCSFVRAHAALASTPVLLISGIVNDEVSRLAESCQADAVIKKPFQGSSLQQQVAAVLAKRAQQPAAEVTPVQTPPSSTGTRAYRITEEQLNGFRHTVARARELETLLAAERARSARLLERLTEAEQLVARAASLYHELARVLQETARLVAQPSETPGRHP
jgi:DNA-binding response OmpR family regulator